MYAVYPYIMCRQFAILTNLWSFSLNPYYGQRPFCGKKANSADPDQTPHNATSDQGLHCLLIDCSIKIGININNTNQQPLKRKWTGLIDNSGKFHSA